MNNLFAMKLHLLLTAFILSSLCTANARAAMVYVSGHADIGVGFEDGGLHLHLHAEQDLGLFGGGTAPAGEYEAGTLTIGVPGPSVPRPAGSQWNFLAPNENDLVWFLEQSDVGGKPFLGVGTEELLLADGWTTPLTWTLNSIDLVSGDASSFAVWQNPALGGAPEVFASTLEPTAEGNSWQQGAEGHEHFNMGFTGEGIYDVTLTITGMNDGSGAIAAGTYSDTASFRFATGTAVPEPSSLVLLGLSSLAGAFYRRRRSVAS